MTQSWTRSLLGDVLNLKRGYDLPDRLREAGEVPIVSSSGISGLHKEAKVKGPSVVTGRYGTLGEVHYVVTDYWPLNTTLYVQDFKGNDPRFISYFLRSMNLGSQNAAGAVPGVNRNHLHMIEVRVPNLAIQRKIASILSGYDDLIENNTRRIAILEEMAQAIYREWFVNFRFPGHENVKLVKSTLGMIPEGWKVVKLKEMYPTSSGGTPSRKKEEYYESGTINWVKTKELKDRFLWDTEEKITESGLKNSSTKIYPKYTVLMAMYGATIGQLGIPG